MALVAAALVVVALLVTALSGTFATLAQAVLILVGGLVFGTILAGAMDWLRHRSKLGHRGAAAVVLSLLTVTALGLLYTMGSHMVDQLGGLATELRDSIGTLRERYEEAEWLDPVRDLSLGSASGESSWAGRAIGGATLVFGGFGDAALLLILAVFVSLDPALYAHQWRLLLPEERRAPVGEAQYEMARALRLWFIGRLFAGALVGVLTWTGLAILGLPMAFTLSLFAALLSFIPNFGPLLSVVPALLVGWAESGETALWVLGVYVVVQIVESNVLTPMIQIRAVSLPPALLLGGQLVFGSLFGILGLFLATPIVVAVTVAIQRLWVIEVRGERIEVIGAREDAS